MVTIRIERRMHHQRDDAGGLAFDEAGDPIMVPVGNENGLLYHLRTTFDSGLEEFQVRLPIPEDGIRAAFTREEAGEVAIRWARLLESMGLIAVVSGMETTPPRDDA